MPSSISVPADTILMDADALAAFTAAQTDINNNVTSITAAVAAAGTDGLTGTPLTTAYNIVTTSTATTADGVRLPASKPAGCVVKVHNASANTIEVFPPTGGTINGGSVDASVTIATTKTRDFYNTTALTWFSSLSA